MDKSDSKDFQDSKDLKERKELFSNSQMFDMAKPLYSALLTPEGLSDLSLSLFEKVQPPTLEAIWPMIQVVWTFADFPYPLEGQATFSPAHLLTSKPPSIRIQYHVQTPITVSEAELAFACVRALGNALRTALVFGSSKTKTDKTTTSSSIPSSSMSVITPEKTDKVIGSKLYRLDKKFEAGDWLQHKLNGGIFLWLDGTRVIPMKTGETGETPSETTFQPVRNKGFFVRSYVREVWPHLPLAYRALFWLEGRWVEEATLSKKKEESGIYFVFRQSHFLD